MDVTLLKLPSLEVVGVTPLGCDQVIPRSVLLAGFEGAAHHHLLVGLGDGGLHSWRMDPDNGRLSGEGGARPFLLFRAAIRGAVPP